MEEKLQALKALLGEVQDLHKAAALLGWDQQTYMPAGGATARAEQLATLHKTAHSWFITDEIGELIEALNSNGAGRDFDSDEASLLRVVARDYEKARKVPSELVAEFARVAPPTRQPDDGLAEPLSEREREILQLMAQGLTNREIADRLILAQGTVKNYVTTILQKMGARDRTQAALRARELGLL